MFLTTEVDIDTHWYQTLAETIPCIYFILDEKGKIVSVSPHAAAQLGFSLDELKGCRIDNIIHWLHKQRLQVALKAFWHNLPAWGGNWEFQLTKKKSATTFWVKIIATKINDFVLLLCEDITERKQTEETLQESEFRFQKLADSMPVMIWTADAEGLVKWCNRTWLAFTGSRLERAIGHGWIENLHPEDKERFLSAYRYCLNSRQKLEIEYRLLFADQEWHWVLSTITPLLSPMGELTGYFSSCIDISASKSLRERLYAPPKQQDLPEFSSQLWECVGNMQIATSLLSLGLEGEPNAIPVQKTSIYLNILKQEFDRGADLIEKFLPA